MEQADVAKLEADIAIQLGPPTNPDQLPNRSDGAKELH
jgi:hypothetical protein